MYGVDRICSKINIQDDFVMLILKSDHQDGLFELGHNFFTKGYSQLLFNYNGELTMTIGNNLTKKIPSHTVLFIKDVEPFKINFRNTKEVVLLLFNLDKFLMNNVGASGMEVKSISSDNLVNLSQLCNGRFEKRNDIFFKAKAYQLLSVALNELFLVKKGYNYLCLDQPSLYKIIKTRKTLEKHYAEPPSIQELSERFNIPVKKLKSGFRSYYGVSIFNFILIQKMKVAKKLLIHNSKDFNVEQIALKVGYSTSSHFIKAFKKVYGITPKVYRTTNEIWS